MYQMSLFEPTPPMPLTQSLSAEDRCVDDMYTVALHGYDSQDPDMMMCCLNEIARLCAQYFQMRDAYINEQH